ncbi:PEP-CTERM sorting domain-containing protein [Verrucomicrobium sp. BvORR106]|uniref:PEP-CTERM sorting domain-containing protein n=1 Tax=Verrucomicrobium sp. BvORR106 TaxID=1403819 RepID=UPI0009DD18C1|nr:PEP-CTERM sorting domain-containing protein [Verrucomicrobium sp. BvORR106]
MTPKTFFQRGAVPVLAMLLGLTGVASGQAIINSADFFDPDFRAERPGSAPGLLTLTVDTSLYNPGSQTDGNVTWTHQAGGLVELDISVVAGVNLAAYTQTTGNTLVFGRELTTTGLVGLLGPTISSVVGASAINSWDSQATVGGLSLGSGSAYTVSFTVASGGGINLNALSAANFGLSSNGVAIQDINTVETLNVLNLLQLGGGLTNIEFTFIAPSNLNQLEFSFDAATIANVSLLGGITDNQNVLTFSNFAVTPVPEPGSLTLLGLGIYFLVRRRNRV